MFKVFLLFVKIFQFVLNVQCCDNERNFCSSLSDSCWNRFSLSLTFTFYVNKTYKCGRVFVTLKIVPILCLLILNINCHSFFQRKRITLSLAIFSYYQTDNIQIILCRKKKSQQIVVKKSSGFLFMTFYKTLIRVNYKATNGMDNRLMASWSKNTLVVTQNHDWVNYFYWVFYWQPWLSWAITEHSSVSHSFLFSFGFFFNIKTSFNFPVFLFVLCMQYLIGKWNINKIKYKTYHLWLVDDFLFFFCEINFS